MFLTITLNPALDKFIYAPDFAIGQVNPIEIRQTLAAGRGVYAAKVLRDLGHPVTVSGLLGQNLSSVFQRLFISKSINDAFVRIQGNTRTNIHMLDGKGGETELLEPAPDISQKEWKNFLERLGQILEGCDMVAICGSVPPGVTPQMFSSMLSMIENYHLPVLIDTQDRMLDVACAKRPRLVKFNRERIRNQLGTEQCSMEQIITYAKGLLKMGVENVLVSLDSEGALLICKEGIFRANAPEVAIRSTIGCGDAMVASIAESLSVGRTPEELLRHAVAISSANCLSKETAQITLSDYHALLDQVTIEKL